MRSFGWLHFTDLHQGLDAQGWLWPGVREVLLADLEKLHARCGPWDLVLFSGDLTQRGSAAEFARLNQTLQQLWDHLRALGSTPALVAVPGNHDLIRPDPRRPESLVLGRWDTYPEVQVEFWRDASSPYRALVDQAFAPYSEWLKNHPFAGLQLQRGMLPGDCSAVLAKDGLKLGIVGLNSAFLQLGDGDYTGKLALDVRQLHAACGGDGPAWVKECDFALLMTHHPPNWLQAKARDELVAEIAPPGRFVAHVYGHMHEHASSVVAIGGAQGRRELQGSSLFGLEVYGGKVDRRHGYTAARITVDDKNEATLRLWPRAAKKHAAGHWRIVQDLDAFELGDDQGTKPETLPPPRRRTPPPPPPPPINPANLIATGPVPSASTSGSHPSISQTAPIPLGVITSLSGGAAGDSGIFYSSIAARVQPPGAPYNINWHVHRAEEERTALNYLDQPGAPVVLWGPDKFGKTWMSQFLTDMVYQADGGACRVVAINLDTFDYESRSDYANFIREFAFQIVGSIGGPEDWVPTLWKSPGSVNQKLGRLMRDNVLPLASTRVILALDRVDAVWGLPFKDDWFGMLRAWAEDPRLEKLRLVLGISTTPRRLIERTTQSPFNLSPPIVLGDFTRDQVETLSHLYGLEWTHQDFAALMSLVGGHPYLVRLAMHRANLAGGLSARELLAEPSNLFDDFLQRYARRLHLHPEMMAGVKRLRSDSLAELDSDTSAALESSGIAVEEKVGFYRLRYRLYERLRP
ncbi:AAA-like domain-containing protein [Nannocystis punicea]|uniref:AAA-like domain-containing protein n=1 Tax=Nannocystis punicea TaxID=2995304 RepID=A0ABY7GYI2_9BACT|nr:AAA-like domain-containing protein [Nannocystis poenicansa]WAS92026.1 AAA-like domain-containing protein [Nannocystis poenicansa]